MAVPQAHILPCSSPALSQRLVLCKICLTFTLFPLQTTDQEVWSALVGPCEEVTCARVGWSQDLGADPGPPPCGCVTWARSSPPLSLSFLICEREAP